MPPTGQLNRAPAGVTVVTTVTRWPTVPSPLTELIDSHPQAVKNALDAEAYAVAWADAAAVLGLETGHVSIDAALRRIAREEEARECWGGFREK